MLKKNIESDPVYVFPQTKSSKIRELLKLGRLNKKDWSEDEEGSDDGEGSEEDCGRE